MLLTQWGKRLYSIFLLMGALTLHPSYMIIISMVIKKAVGFCFFKPNLVCWNFKIKSRMGQAKQTQQQYL